MTYQPVASYLAQMYSEKEERMKGQIQIFEQILVKNFLNLIKRINRPI